LGSRVAACIPIIDDRFRPPFAGHKRATLPLNDPTAGRGCSTIAPAVQFIFAGKAHPQDEPGKELIRELIGLIAQPEFRGKVVFVEDYDINVAGTWARG
jgi:starch phosphorylase